MISEVASVSDMIVTTNVMASTVGNRASRCWETHLLVHRWNATYQPTATPPDPVSKANAA